MVRRSVHMCRWRNVRKAVITTCIQPYHVLRIAYLAAGERNTHYAISNLHLKALESLARGLQRRVVFRETEAREWRR